MSKRIRIGCQSWGYADWITPAGGETVFYPRGTKPSEMLELYANVFDTIEVDSSAYGPPSASAVEGWAAKTPPNFQFSLKTPRRITHDFPAEPAIFPEMDEFIERAELLQEKLGAVLIQFPASFESTKENAQNLRAFLRRLPASVRFAVEFRNPGWFVDWTYDELASNSVALALVEGKWVERSAMFEAIPKLSGRSAYVRFMGLRNLEKFDRVQRPQDDVLQTWAKQIDSLDSDEIFIYVDNYLEGFAPETANKLKRLLRLAPVSPEVLEEQPSLF